MDKESFEFNAEKYQKASAHQQEWGQKLISEFDFSGNEKILDLGCGDGNITGYSRILLNEWSDKQRDNQE